MPPANPVARPESLDGCWGTWAETTQANTIRSTMDTGLPKVRRRFTGSLRKAQVTVQLPRDLVADFEEWYTTYCVDGSQETYMVDPRGNDTVWRFTKPPEYSWNYTSGTACQITCTIEKLPGWP